MTFEYLVAALGWFAALLFVVVAGYRMLRIARLPLNVRWEVYPVPHEPKAKRAYGGSYMEEVDWATAARPKSSLPAYLEIAVEVATLKRVKAHNSYGVWPLSLAMHWGIYLYFAWLLLLGFESWVRLPGLSQLTTFTGVAACILGAGGALGLLFKRAVHRDLQPYTTPLDYFNLLFLAAVFLALLVSWLADKSFATQKAYVGSVLAFKPVPAPNPVLWSFLLLELFVVYMPFTKLIHYFAKYFTFDRALWDDDFKAKGSVRDQAVAAQLAYRVNWAAPHIVPKESWLQQAQTSAAADRK